MIAIQLRHTKLWFAGKFNNWKLATYELDQMENALDQAMRLSSGGTPDAIAKQASSIRASIEAKDFGEFAKGFTALTRSCNACHRATGHEFITVGVPAYSPYPDQIFDDQLAKGRALARSVCGTCHFVPGNQAGSVATLGPPGPNFVDLANRPSLTEESLRQFLASSHRRIGTDQAMPNPRLNESQIEQIIAYFEALKSDSKH
jgi:mono/diheme cytochrome c family protein